MAGLEPMDCRRCGAPIASDSVPERRQAATSWKSALFKCGIDGAVNLQNRKSKREKFCFETSEDAITWTVWGKE